MPGFEIIKLEDIPKKIEFKNEGKPTAINGRNYQLMTGIEKLSGGDRLIKIIVALAFTIFTIGFALVLASIRSSWSEGLWGERKLAYYVEIKAAPKVEVPPDSAPKVEPTPEVKSKPQSVLSVPKEMPPTDVKEKEKEKIKSPKSDKSDTQTKPLSPKSPVKQKEEPQAIEKGEDKAQSASPKASAAKVDTVSQAVLTPQTPPQSQQLIQPTSEVEKEVPAHVNTPKSSVSLVEMPIDSTPKTPHSPSALKKEPVPNKSSDAQAEVTIDPTPKTPHSPSGQKKESEPDIEKDKEPKTPVVIEPKLQIDPKLGEVSPSQDPTPTISIPLSVKHSHSVASKEEEFSGEEEEMRILEEFLAEGALCANRSEYIAYIQKHSELCGRIHSTFEEEIQGAKSMADHFNAIFPEEIANDKDKVIEIVKKHHFTMGLVSPQLRKDPDVVLAATLKDELAFFFAHETCKANRELIDDLIEKGKGVYFKFIAKELQDDQELVMRALVEKQGIFAFISPRLRAVREVALEAVKHSGTCLQYALGGLRGDPEVVKAAIGNEAEALSFASKELRGQKEIVELAVNKDPMVIEYASKEFRADKEFVEAAVRKNPRAFKFADSTLRRDPEYVLKMVDSRKSGIALKYAHESLRDNPEIVKKALHRSWDDAFEILKFTSPRLKDDMPFMQYAVGIQPSAIKFASTKLQEDPELICKALHVCQSLKKEDILDFNSIYTFLDKFKENEQVVKARINALGPEELERVLPTFRSDEKFVLSFVQNKPKIVEFAAPELRQKPEFIEAAVKIKGEAIAYVDATFQNNPQIFLEACKTYPEVLKHVTSQEYLLPSYIKDVVVPVNPNVLNFLSYDLMKQILKEMIVTNLDILQHLSYNYKRNKDLFLELMDSRVDVLKHSEGLQGNEEIIQKAIAYKQFSWALAFGSDTQKGDPAFVMQTITTANWGLGLSFALPNVQGNFEVVKAAVERDPTALQFASTEFQSNPELMALAQPKTESSATAS